MRLLERRAEVAARAKILCSVGGSGWHKSDPGEMERRANGGVALTEKLIGLRDDDRVYLVGPCVPLAIKGLAEYASTVLFIKAKRREEIAKAESELDANPNAKVAVPSELEYSPVEKHAYTVARRWAKFVGDEIALPLQDWNGVLFAFSQVGIQCVISDANVTPEEEKV